MDDGSENSGQALPILGTAGLTNRTDPSFGHPAAMREPPELEPERPEGPRQAMPAQCMRQMTAGKPGECASHWGTCPGQQRDGGCLLSIVRAAKAAGVRWLFEIDPHDAYWDYCGEPIPGFITERRDYGQIHTRWEEGYEPPDPYNIQPTPPPEFDCPHCGAHNMQDHENFHWWCQSCGRNAKEA